MVYIRGHAFDYDRWQEEGCEGWSYADCLPYFRKAQNHCLGKVQGCSVTNFSWPISFTTASPELVVLFDIFISI